MLVYYKGIKIHVPNLVIGSKGLPVIPNLKEDEKTAVLGVAVLGKMVLGKGG